MQFDHDRLQQLLAFLCETDIQEFRLEEGDFRLEVRRPPAHGSVLAAPVPTPSEPPMPVAPSPVPAAAPPQTTASRSELHEITAPMVGTFYRAPAPGDAPFVEVGSRIGIGQTVCILEAMKLMNELEAEVAGEVVEILLENGTPVEFGQVLMRVRPA
ncbi:acetyl-CoA carboxylase biotin carboxyl carrier protein [Synechococcus sp. RSCCF101]|uniref:acetyl-CoA carboxylase biotin carboxyl carrier protein n=1 Tax=Synechococcus sp. RSCCF101 TaxID=2511069 RepID=UPI0012489589|nr:acetyl-CoA carboxylase biotin carboxyl carrier protein [Synechococcus sp. RSCCF101]QEY32560.1 acetyl-CoA carboxylase biotin carboxyl carrier protein [Synechococcus sp. RSCCF101]